MIHSDPAVRFLKVEKNFGERRLFRGLDLEIESGEFLCLLGPSGCGKSTLLRVIGGLEKLDQGEMKVEVQPNKLGFVFQEPRLLSWRTAAENIALPSEIQGPKISEERLHALLAQVQLEKNVQSLFPRQLSGGMKMRVALARALSNQPTLLLMDEPLAALDETTRFRLQEEIRKIYELAQPNLTIVFVTHSVSEAAFLASRIIVMNHNGEKASDLRNNLHPIRGEEIRREQAYFERTKEISERFREISEGKA